MFKKIEILCTIQKNTSRKRCSGTRNSLLINYSRPRARETGSSGCTLVTGDVHHLHSSPLNGRLADWATIPYASPDGVKQAYIRRGLVRSLSSVVINWLFKHVQGIVDIPGATVFIDGKRRADFSCKSEIVKFLR